jgi:xanthine/uracil permease
LFTNAVNFVEPAGNALVTAARAESDVERTPPLRRTVLTGQVAVAFACVCCGFPIWANVVV